MTATDLEATIFAFLADVQGDDTTHRLVLSDFLLFVRRKENGICPRRRGKFNENGGQAPDAAICKQCRGEVW